MKKYRILVVDDEIFVANSNRRSVFDAFLANDWKAFIQQHYDKNVIHLTDEQVDEAAHVFEKYPSNFEVDYVDNATDEAFRTVVDGKNYDAIFLDVDFGKAPVETSFKEVLSVLAKTLIPMPPVMVYTGYYQEDVINTINDAFYHVLGDRTPSRYYVFSRLLNICTAALLTDFSKVEKSRKIIRRIISMSKGEVLFNPCEEDKVAILHISDLQFGDKNASKSLNGLANSIASHVGKIDVLVITGDVAMEGQEEEFNEALLFLQCLRGKIWPYASEQERMDRTIVIPGNHDFDLKTSLLPFFDVKFEKTKMGDTVRKFDFGAISEQIKDGVKISSDREIYGLQAYREFAYRLTNRIEYLNSQLDFVDSRFLNWGLIFYCLNSVGKINANETNKVYLAENSDEMVTPDLTLAIALCHHTFLCEAPGEIPMEDEEQFKKTLYGYITGNNCRIIMGGHRHKGTSGDGKLKHEGTFHICEAASLRVEGDDKDYIRGYNKYTLKKEGNIFKTITEEFFSIDEGDSSTDCLPATYDIPAY